MKENKEKETFLSVVNAVGDDLWHDVSLPADYEGVFKYRRLSNQDILQIYADVEYNGSNDDSAIFYIPESVSPANSKTITGFVTYRQRNTNTTRTQFLNIHDDGELYIPGYTDQIITDFMFNGMIDL